MKKHLATVNWKTYFDTDNNPRAKRYLESRGYDVFKQVGANIVRAKKAKKREIIFLAHPNAMSLVSIPESEYDEFLTKALEWFKLHENYEECAQVLDWRTYIRNHSEPSLLEFFNHNN